MKNYKIWLATKLWQMVTVMYWLSNGAYYDNIHARDRVLMASRPLASYYLGGFY